MVGFTVHAERARGSAPGATRRSAPPFEPSRRPFVPRMLWGTGQERCAECGSALSPGAAYRLSARAVYCSPEHAERDLRG